MVHSLTKWLGGHGVGIGGIVIDGGKFNWTGGHHPLFDEPDESYHGLRWGHDLPEALAPLAYILRMRTVPLRNLGACISPDNSWFFIQGIETLPLRMERHCENSLAVAKFLQNHPAVEWVRYPGLKDDSQYELQQKYLKGKGGAMVVFRHQGRQRGGQQIHRKREIVLASGQRRRRQKSGDSPGDDDALTAQSGAAVGRRHQTRIGATFDWPGRY